MVRILGCLAAASAAWLIADLHEAGAASRLPAGVPAAALLLLRYSGRRPTKRAMEMIRFYLLGYATLEELSASIALEQKAA